MKFRFTLLLLMLLLTRTTNSLADGPKDNSLDNVRPIPPVGIELTADQQLAFRKRLDVLASKITELAKSKNTLAVKLLPDVQIFHRAVLQATVHQEMFHERDIKAAHTLLDIGEQRADQLSNGQAPWTRQHGFVVRGFVSALDGTVQPYGLEIASDYDFDHPAPVRCDLWFHGRGERSMELHFIAQRLNRTGPYPPATGMVLHPYGRYSNAFKFAGEVDTLEALQHAQENYNIDPDRISARGFSMGGAGCWQFAVHYADQWFAANPGAGFSETPQFLKSFQGETLNPPWYEEKLWLMYDCDHWAENLRQLPTVAYSGEIDRQKQAADVMERALDEHNIELMHVIGPETAHKIHADSNRTIRQKMDALADRGRQQFPRMVNFTTYTLKYDRMHWVTVEGLKEHWEKSSVQAAIAGDHALKIDTSNVTMFSVNFPAGSSPFDLQSEVWVTVDGQKMPVEKTLSDLSFHVRYSLQGEKWERSDLEKTQLSKKHNLQGPVDDALMTPFMFVTSSKEIKQPMVQKWVSDEMARAVKEWRRHMRGDVRIKSDVDVTEADIQNYNLILWGTPESNSIMRKVSQKLPIIWNAKEIAVGDRKYSAENHVPILVYPNPLNPDRYLVYNSSFTYREYDYLNNARQTPKLPDWSIINLETAPDFRWPGKVVDANFFNEQWGLK